MVNVRFNKGNIQIALGFKVGSSLTAVWSKKVKF